ncbi:MAG: ABC transporter ATP-binding protein [Acidimicrobiales bacterium]
MTRLTAAPGRHLVARPVTSRLASRLRVLASIRDRGRALQPVLGGRMWPIAMLGGISILAGLVEAGMLDLLANIAAAMVLHGQRAHVELSPTGLYMTVGFAILVTFVLSAARLVLQLVMAWIPTRIATNVLAEVRRELFDAFTRASWAVKAHEREGHFQELMTNQVNQAINAVMNLAGMISAGAMFIALVASAFSLSVVVASLVLVSAAVLFAAFRPLDKLGGIAARDASQASIDQAGGISEAVRLAEEAQVFGVVEAQRGRLNTLIEATRRATFRATLTARMVGSLYQSAVFLLIVGGLGGLYVSGTGNLASLGAVVLILVRASSYGQALQTGNHLLVQVLPWVDRLYGAINRYKASAPVGTGAPFPELRNLAFDRVSFSYRPGQAVLHDVSFELEAGQTIGIIGPTGAGKSTISHLLLRLREPDTGAYAINGLPVGRISLPDWRRRVAYVSQEPRLFDGTVANNIRFFRDIDDVAVEAAARLAHVHQDISAMPAGYGTVIGQTADAVSGGQRQRLCLARALAGQPQILLLDEPTSQLDLASEAAVEASLERLHGSLTIFIIAHRLSILRVCDRVLVLEHGRVSAFGTLEELARSDAFYQRVSALAAR